MGGTKQAARVAAISENQLRRKLELTANNFFTIIEKGDPKDLLLLCSSRGVVFGVDEPPIRLAVIREQIEKRQGIYCALFDTDCLRKEDAAERAKAAAPPRTEALYSYRERFLKASAREIKISVSADVRHRSGDVIITLTGDLQPHDPVQFEFVYEHGNWKLTALPFY